jgi:adenylate kinase family enzyme
VTSARHTARVRHGAGGAHPLVVELVGAAAVGKSTLVTELRRRDPGIHWLQRARGDGGHAAVARHAVAFAPAWLASASRSPKYAWRNARYFLRLAALEDVVRRGASVAGSAVLLEHGPVYTLARLRAFHEGPAPAPLARYAARLLSRWAKRLDLVIALEAPLDVLDRRLRSRDKDHAMRERSTDEFHEFVRRYRAAYATVLAELHAAGGPPVLTLRTDRSTVAAMADRVEAAFRERQDAR